MARLKEQRWYEVQGDVLYVYNQPSPKHSTFVSMVKLSDFGYYRRTFELRKCWSN